MPLPRVPGAAPKLLLARRLRGQVDTSSDVHLCSFVDRHALMCVQHWQVASIASKKAAAGAELQPVQYAASQKRLFYVRLTAYANLAKQPSR